MVFAERVNKTSSIVYREKLALKYFGSYPDEEQVINELRIWSSLGHANIVKLITISYVGFEPVAVMPFYWDGCIANDPYTRGNFKNIKAMLVDVASALEFALSRGVIHLDVKPNNIFRRSSDYGLADWGISKILANLCLSPAYQDRLIGTLPFMPPERILHDVIDFRADIYALGISTYQLLFNTLPFDTSSSDSLVYSIISGEYWRRIQSLRPAGRQDWLDFIVRATDPEPNNRFRDYRELIRACSYLGN